MDYQLTFSYFFSNSMSMLSGFHSQKMIGFDFNIQYFHKNTFWGWVNADEASTATTQQRQILHTKKITSS